MVEPSVNIGVLTGIGITVGFWLICWKGGYTRGLDGFRSLANLQLILWTGIILGSYVALSIITGKFVDNFSQNTIILIAIATGTTPVSAIIRRLQNPPQAQQNSAHTAGLLASEKHPTKPSIAKVQMFSWNLIAMFLFELFLWTNVSNGNYQFPDIGQTFYEILGISNGVYLANKTADKSQ